MGDTGFRLNGVDIVNMFELIGVTNAGEDTGYKSSTYNKDLSNIFKNIHLELMQVILVINSKIL